MMTMTPTTNSTFDKETKTGERTAEGGRFLATIFPPVKHTTNTNLLLDTLSSVHPQRIINVQDIEIFTLRGQLQVDLKGHITF